MLRVRTCLLQLRQCSNLAREASYIYIKTTSIYSSLWPTNNQEKLQETVEEAEIHLEE
jgi:hypothetical protein